VDIRDKLKANAEPLLQPGEELQAVFRAQTVYPYLGPISALLILVGSAVYRVVVVTDRRILMCRGDRVTMAPIHEVLAEVPRQTMMGPAHGLWYRTDSLGDRLYINRSFHAEVAAADAAI
jgi:hypothetical protein